MYEGVILKRLETAKVRIADPKIIKHKIIIDECEEYSSGNN